MNPGNVDTQSHFINALWTQASHHKAEPRPTTALSCPYCDHQGRVFQSPEQLLDHARIEHDSEFKGLASPRAREKLVKALRKSGQPTEAAAGDDPARHSSPDIAALSLEPGQDRQTSPTGKKRRADSELHAGKDKVPSHVEIADPDCSRNIPFSNKGEKVRSKRHDARLYNPKHGAKGTMSPRRSITEPSSEWSIDIGNSLKSLESPTKQGRTIKSQPRPTQPRQPGLIELQRYDPRYPGLLLQPDSRPISQEQLASEVKSIYAGLTMVETKCIHVDRAQAAVPHEANPKLAPDHWQALIALHRTLLHEHHDFFLASQHPSASPALRRLAGKYTMPARMWKHGIHSFLELLRKKLPHSLDYMLAFIYLAYQMMALLYETVPAFEDTWIECLGDLGRYRMAIEDEDIRDRETWAGVARSWYSKAADKNPTVGRLYHHLAILARPNALQQLYYYTTSLNCVEPFPSARESIMTLFKPLIQDDQTTYTGINIDTKFTKSHALLFTRFAKPGYEQASQDFLDSLDNHIGRVTAKWKEQGVYIAVSNITAWFDYGIDLHVLRQLFLLRAFQRKSTGVQTEQQLPTISADQPKPTDPKITEDQVPSQVDTLSTDSAFAKAKLLTSDTFALALRRIGDKNVLPHVHVMLSFLSTLASVPYVSHLVDHTPWTELVSFLNTLIKIETQKNNSLDINALLSQSVFPGDNETKERDELPLPEDYLVRGLVWAQEYLPANWLGRERDEEERYLELASTAKSRTERVLRLGYRLSTTGRWISYDQDTYTFAVVNT
ncbi:hypothetical protein BU25DRAFT_457015 [Macroventuria anomochaeta]|uniref:Uncharacterized protein n=1 Tax=Macroventuria anomochaeta TaxID=301207 RepID=A0ACB6S5S7_9PLEO|nr:uncharacterized protein BU25DRAFT_457015 [Macroventuria anomochaeta]KAF2629342.1 hypothetical protein BU25DRAFT_457015 [Macroventuria anomochaeta]